jgi:hypothetical protein
MARVLAMGPPSRANYHEAMARKISRSRKVSRFRDLTPYTFIEMLTDPAHIERARAEFDRQGGDVVHEAVIDERMPRA